MANLRVALDDPLVLGQTVEPRSSVSGKALALVSMLMVGAVVGVAVLNGSNAEESAISMPILKLPTKSGLRSPIPAQATRVQPTCALPNKMVDRLDGCFQQQPRHATDCLTAAAAVSPQHTVYASSDAVTEADVLAAQAAWANAIKSISKVYLDKGDYVATAATAAGELYGYGHTEVLFKPTKAAEYPFRPTPEEAMSYFVGGKAVDNGYAEDGGFAINGGKGWSDVVFDNHQVALKGGVGIAMGEYVFTCATTGDKNKVEYTFGYQKCDDGKTRIFLHHSSVPYTA